MIYKLMVTPGVVIDGKVVHAAGVPARSTVVSGFRDGTAGTGFVSPSCGRRACALEALAHIFLEIVMENPVHAFKDLFEQLGLPSESEAIKNFIEANRPLAPEVELADAGFWNAGQASFIREELLRDADWAELVDQLDASLR